MTPEREKEIRARLTAFKHWKSVSDNPASYLESHGPDMEELLSEIDVLREVWRRDDNLHCETQMKNFQLLDDLDRVREENDQLRTEIEILKNPSDGRCMEIVALRSHANELIKQRDQLRYKLEPLLCERFVLLEFIESRDLLFEALQFIQDAKTRKIPG